MSKEPSGKVFNIIWWAIIIFVFSDIFLWTQPQNPITLFVKDIYSFLSIFPTVKVILFGVVVCVALFLLYKNLDKWAQDMRQWMIHQAKKDINQIKTFERPWTIYLFKFQLILGTLVFLAAIFNALFGTIYY